jgi:hypothetical protein
MLSNKNLAQMLKYKRQSINESPEKYSGNNKTH